MKQTLIAIASLSILLHAGSTPATTCEAAKERAAGKKITRKMACHAKAKGAGTAVDGACLAKAEAKFAAAFARIEGACPGDEATVEDLVDSCVVELVSDVASDGQCAKKSVRVLGKWTSRVMSCAARESTDPGTFAACDAAADAKAFAALTKAGSCTSPSSHAHVHSACVEPIVAAVVSVTTTVSTSTSTSTTSPPSCCDPACDPGDSCVTVFMAGSTTCGCIPASTCSLGKCVLPAPVCDSEGCPPGYSCFDHSYCLGLPCADAAGSCGCPASEQCYLNVP